MARRPVKKKKGAALFVLEIIILLFFIGGLYVYGQIQGLFNKINTNEIDLEKVQMNENSPKMTGYRNIALFAQDSRGEGSQYSAENSDTIIVVSINNDTGEVKMVSVYRDTLLDVGDDTYQKANAAYAYGGPEQALSMLNTNLDLQLTDYMTVDFNAMATVVDLMGGLDIPLSYDEIEHMNNYCVETSEVTGKDYTPIEKPAEKPEEGGEAILGTYHLNGVQVTSYCRIRYTSGYDMKRTERQRMVIQMLADKAKKSSLSTLFKIVDEVFPMVETNLQKQDLLEMGMNMMSYRIDETTGFPYTTKDVDLGSKGEVLVPDTLESNVIQLHEFLYPGQSYTPSSTIQERSQKIRDISGI